jgi:hypothetical protein
MSKFNKIAAASVIAILSAISLAARAGTYNYTENISGASGDSANGISFDPHVFNNSLGTLTGVSFSFTGNLGITGFDALLPPGYEQLTPVYFKNTASVIGDGFTPPGGNPPVDYNLPNSSTGFVVMGGDNVSVSALISANFGVLPGSIADYANPANAPTGNSFPGTLGFPLSGYLQFDSIAYIPTPGRGRLGFGSWIDQFQGTMTQTFTYTPVPEPGSLALLGTAVAMLAGAARLTTRRPRS